MSGNAASGGGTGAALGTQVLRYSGIHSAGVVASNALTFVSTIVIANFIDPDAFGQLGLLLFLVGLMTLLFTLASKQGTMKRTFGGDDDDEDDDEEEDVSISPRRTFGTGLILIAIVSTIGTLLTVVFAEPIADLLLGEDFDHKLVVWAAVAGGTGALYRVASIAIWLERRPYPYIAVDRSGRFLLSASYGAHQVAVNPIGKDGKVQVVHVGFNPNMGKVLTKDILALLAGKDLAGEALAKFEESQKRQEASEAAETPAAEGAPVTPDGGTEAKDANE